MQESLPLENVFSSVGLQGNLHVSAKKYPIIFLLIKLQISKSGLFNFIIKLCSYVVEKVCIQNPPIRIR